MVAFFLSFFRFRCAEGFTPVDDRVPNWIDFSAYDKVGIPFLVEKSQPPPISLYSTPSAPSGTPLSVCSLHMIPYMISIAAVAMSVGQQQAQAQPDRGVLSYNRNRQSVRRRPLFLCFCCSPRRDPSQVAASTLGAPPPPPTAPAECAVTISLLYRMAC